MKSKNISLYLHALILGAVFCVTQVLAQPPFGGTIFIDPDIITSNDPTTFSSMEYSGRRVRSMFDRRKNRFVDLKAYLFTSKYDDGFEIEIQVNPEFGSVDAAKQQAAFYAPVFGRLPSILRSKVKTSWIHSGDQAFGGGNNNLLIHVGSIGQSYIRDGILEEALVHEAVHTSLDPKYRNDPRWRAAQQSDSKYISTYAQENSEREDMAESFLPYLAVRYRRNRISRELAQKIEQAIPARIAYFETLNLDLHPLATRPVKSGVK